jgi:hypothetical protein
MEAGRNLYLVLSGVPITNKQVELDMWNCVQRYIMNIAKIFIRNIYNMVTVRTFEVMSVKVNEMRNCTCRNYARSH